MVNYRLILINEQGSPNEYVLNAPMEQGIPMAVTYQVADIREPEKRKGDFSKTLRIPGTAEIDRFFEFVFDVNVNLQKWNPNKRIEAFYYKRELLQFSGKLQVLEILVDEITGQRVYECVIKGQVLSLFTDIKDKLLTDIDFSVYNHTLNYQDVSEVILNSNVRVSGILTPVTNGFGYRYAVMDLGANNSNTHAINPADLKPVLFVEEFVRNIFNAAGYTYTGFFASTFFKTLVIYKCDPPKLSQTVLNNNRFQSLADGTQTAITVTLLGTSPGALTYSSSTLHLVEFVNEQYDVGNVFNTSTQIFTCGLNGKYNIHGSVAVQFDVFKDVTNINASTSTTFVPTDGQIVCYLLQGNSVIGTSTIPFTQSKYGASNLNVFSINLENVQLQATVQYKVVYRLQSIVFGSVLSADTYTFRSSFVGGTFEAQLSSDSIAYGQPINVNDCIPEMRQVELLSNLTRMFNLHWMVDKTNPKNLIVQARPDFYTSTAKNMTKKKDAKKKRRVIPLGDLDARTFKFEYAEDGDYFNALHKNTYNETYGTHTESIDNDFVEGERNIKVTFAATPLAYGSNGGLPVSSIVKKETTVITEHKGKARILIFNPSVTIPGTKWSLQNPSGAGISGATTYPFVGHVDNPYNPTIDINWGLPKKLYYVYQNQFWTNNNLVNKYYRKQINQTTDKNSKVIREYYFLNEKDINELDFRVPWFVDDAYYYVNRVIDHDPTNDDSTEVELLKLTEYADFSPTNSEFNGGLGNSNTSWAKQVGLNLENGNSNTNLGENSAIIGGSGNYIEPGAQNIILENCTNVVVPSTVSNFKATNVTNYVAEVEDIGTELKKPNQSLTITEDITLNKSYNGKTLFVNATAGDVEITWNASEMEDVVVNIYRVDAAASLVLINDVGSFGTETYKGNSLPYDLGMNQYDKIELTSKADVIL